MMVEGIARIVAALVLSCLAVAIVIMGMFGGFAVILPIAFVIALLLAFVVALPAYLLLRRRWGLTLWAAMLAGFILGALAALSLSLPPMASGAIPLVVPNWFQRTIAASTYGMIGAIGGLVFCVTLRSRGAGADVDDGPHRKTWRKVGLPILWFIVLTGLAMGLMYLSFDLARDRSCHNPLRDGRTMIQSEINMRLAIGEHDWRALEGIFQEFAHDRGWSIRSDVRPTQNGFDWLQISICEESGTEFSAHSLPNEVAISVLQPQGGSSWRASFRDLHLRLSERWPAGISFLERGHEVAGPEWLRTDE